VRDKPNTPSIGTCPLNYDVSVPVAPPKLYDMFLEDPGGGTTFALNEMEASRKRSEELNGTGF